MIGMVLTPEVIGAIEKCGTSFIVTFFQSALIFSSVVLLLGIVFLTIVSFLFRDIILKWMSQRPKKKYGFPEINYEKMPKMPGYQPVGGSKKIKEIPEGGSGLNK